MTAQSRWSLRNIYLYLVCLITLIMVIFAVVNLVRSTVELIYPDPGYYSVEAPVKGGPTAADLEKQRAVAERQSRRQAVLSLVGSFAMLAVAGPLYIYHWRKIESEKDVENVPTAAAPPGA